MDSNEHASDALAHPDDSDRGRMALAVSEGEDEIAGRERAARRHLRWSLLPGVGVTTFWVASAVLGVGPPAGVLATIFAIVTAREGKKQYDHRYGLRAARARLDEVVTGAGSGSATEGPASGGLAEG